MTYNITERLSSTVNYNFNRVLYQAPQYIDYTTHQMGLNFNYLMKNERTTLTNTNIVRETISIQAVTATKPWGFTWEPTINSRKTGSSISGWHEYQ